MFNLLCGKNYKTVNYPGSTVEYLTSSILEKYDIQADLLDSPGIISLNPESPDEKVSVDSLLNPPGDKQTKLVIVTIDSTQLTRHLLLAKQLKLSGFRIIIVLTMVDLLKKRGYDINADLLSEKCACPVIKIDGRTGNGIENLLIEIRHSLNDSILTPIEKVRSSLKEFSKDELLEIYSENEKIEKDCIHEINSPVNKDQLNKANAEINIIQDRNVKASLKIDETTRKIDSILLHKSYGILIFILIMTLIFSSIFWLANPLMQLVDEFFGDLASKANTLFGQNLLGDLISNGIISGTGSVLVFVPQIIILFLILGLLEDTGYLARGAMLIDKPLSKIGLNGRSFVPMLTGFACAIPAMLATRTIPNRRERLLTIFIIPLMSCSARLPVYALLIAYLTPPDKPWLGGVILTSIYILSILSSAIISAIINKTKNKLVNVSDNSSFILELPTYRFPKFRNILYNTIDRTFSYIKRAGPVIILFSLSLWFLTYFPDNNPKVDTAGLSENEIIELQNAERLSNSYAAGLGKLIQPIMTPLGMDWRVGVSLISAFAAREVFVSSLALIFKVTGEDETLQASMLDAMKKAEIEGTGKKLFTKSTIIGLIVFFVFAMQCLSTAAVARKETGSWRIPILQIIIFSTFAYVFTFITVNVLQAIGIS
ncbi:MAG: ferrous iron transport protein B [Ignavibacteriaceae bacterium]|nr:ferrous iron transport protein B [Ignavibacteriaceae bacterium]